ncbi:MAG TPA: ABC transporter ATP-binding protein [Methylomirabilota bacterium]|jgi:NitT/TauT family transport system ATP-binding protein|nr:ABC transporter ATP-binding protein [Methylomirabilota bacterium]
MTQGRVECRGLTKMFGDEWARQVIVERASFVVEAGQLNVMIGPSGCGKSTLINLIAGYEQATSGEILIDGERVQGPGRDRLVVFQETALFPWMTSLENVMFGPEVGGMNRREARQDARRLLEKVGLKGFEDKYPAQLSGGMQRRCELARALINQPRIMLMDEPFRGLDAMTRELMQEYLLRLFEETHHTVLFVTSELEEAIFLADRLLILTAKPTSVKQVLAVDLPRPRDFHALTSSRYAELKQEALEALYQEAVKAFAKGSKAAYDLVEAFGRRVSS